MSTTGIIRRIDELGRIVIPKEIRKNLRIKNGDNLEILVDGENITLKKYSHIDNLESIASMYAESFYQVLKYNVIITDIYAAREQNKFGVSSLNLVNEIEKQGKNAKYISEFSDIVKFLKENVKENDIIITLGAGTITNLGKMLVWN